MIDRREATAAGPAVPQAAEMERGVLSVVLREADFALPVARGILKDEEAFHVPGHRIIWRGILDLADAGEPVDPMSLQRLLEDRGLLQDAGGAGHLFELYTHEGALPAHVTHYAEQVAEKAAQRAIVHAAWKAADKVMADPEQWREHAAALVDVVVGATTSAQRRATIVPIRSAILEAVEEIENAISNRGHVTQGFATGFTDLDRVFMGLRRGDNCFIAARPSMGKTALAVNILENMSLGEGHYREFYNDTEEWPNCSEPRQGRLTTVLVCLESSQIKMAKRLLMGRARVSLQRIRDGLMGRNDSEAITKAAMALGQSQLHIWDAAGVTVEELELELKAFKQRRPDLAVVCVDHCGLLGASGVRDKGNDYARVGYISNRLRNLWKTLDVVGLPIWQLSREVEKRGDKRPQLADLRDSGKLEEDATHVVMPYRPHYYNEEEPADEAYLVIGKNRDGPTNKEGIPVRWMGEFTRFASLRDRLLSNNERERQPH